MTRMPDFEAEVRRDLGRLVHHHHGAPQPAALPSAAPMPHNGPQEDHMSFIAELENDARALASKISSVDHDALNALEAIQANPETSRIFTLLAAATSLPLTPGLLSTAADVLRLVIAQAPPPAAADVPPAPVPVPAGPQVAGQA